MELALKRVRNFIFFIHVLAVFFSFNSFSSLENTSTAPSQMTNCPVEGCSVTFHSRVPKNVRDKHSKCHEALTAAMRALEKFESSCPSSLEPHRSYGNHDMVPKVILNQFSGLKFSHLFSKEDQNKILEILGDIRSSLFFNMKKETDLLKVNRASLEKELVKTQVASEKGDDVSPAIEDLLINLKNLEEEIIHLNDVQHFFDAQKEITAINWEEVFPGFGDLAKETAANSYERFHSLSFLKESAERRVVFEASSEFQFLKDKYLKGQISLRDIKDLKGMSSDDLLPLTSVKKNDSWKPSWKLCKKHIDQVQMKEASLLREGGFIKEACQLDLVIKQNRLVYERKNKRRKVGSARGDSLEDKVEKFLLANHVTFVGESDYKAALKLQNEVDAKRKALKLNPLGKYRKLANGEGTPDYRFLSPVFIDLGNGELVEVSCLDCKSSTLLVSDLMKKDQEGRSEKDEFNKFIAQVVKYIKAFEKSILIVLPHESLHVDLVEGLHLKLAQEGLSQRAFFFSLEEE